MSYDDLSCDELSYDELSCDVNENMFMVEYIIIRTAFLVRRDLSRLDPGSMSPWRSARSQLLSD